MNSQYSPKLLTGILKIFATVTIYVVFFAFIHTIPMNLILEEFRLPSLSRIGPIGFLGSMLSSSLLITTWIIPSFLLALHSTLLFWLLLNKGAVRRVLSGLPVAVIFGYAIACELLSIKHVVGKADYVVVLMSIILTCASWVLSMEASFFFLPLLSRDRRINHKSCWNG